MFYSKRIAQFSDYQNILALINDGKRQMTAAGITQWDDSYPNRNVILQDIEHQQLWIYGEHFDACVTISRVADTTFIQRLVVSSSHQRNGLARFILKDILQKEENESEITQIKISTNTSNIPIKNLVTSLNFIPCRKYEMAGREQFGTFIEYVHPINNCK
ncbi:GNAT family N-acetyltransferase [Enterococcus avium]|uniref:GNAT family N-acetyltransferase n=2 Tax=Enterococcus avium TaxID=33945 RepID=UPI001D0E2DEB|nr:GNAT family N-acetyltransferase [Enterococcus avium]